MNLLPAGFRERIDRFHLGHASLSRLFKLIDLTRRGRPLPPPRFMFVEPTNACNYKCLKCPHSEGLQRPTTTLDVDLFEKLVRELDPGVTLTLHHSGEPMLHPRIFDLIAIARKRGLKTVFFTNASLLHIDDFRVVREGPDSLTFSIDGVSPDAYENSHKGVEWAKIAANIEEFFKRIDGSSPVKFFQITLVRSTQTDDDVKKYLEFASRFPFHSKLVVPCFEWPTGKKIAPVREFPKDHLVFPCAHPWLSPAIHADGSVVPCCLDARGLGRAGNIRDKSFMEIYNGDAMNKLRRHLLDLDGTPPLALCDSCEHKVLGKPMSFKGRVGLATLPIWKYFFKNLPKSVDA